MNFHKQCIKLKMHQSSLSVYNNIKFAKYMIVQFQISNLKARNKSRCFVISGIMVCG